MNKEVFINCPFDTDYENLFDAMLFAIYYCGFKPRCALECDNGMQVRLDKIFSIIEECDLGIHDISRTELNINNLPRFNMPFEFGIFLGARRYGGQTQKKKSCLIFDKEEYRYQEFLSDIAGQDIKSHENDSKKIIKKIRDWLRTIETQSQIPGATYIIEKYNNYITDIPNILIQLELREDDIQYADKTQIIEYWIQISNS